MTGPATAFPGGPLWGMGQGGAPPSVPPNVAGVHGRPQNGGMLEWPLPEVLPIPSATEFNPLGQATSVGVETNTVIAGTVLDVPKNNMAVIRGVSLYITSMLTTTNVTWSLLINGMAPQGFNHISIFPRAAPFVSNGFDAMVRFNGPATVQIVFSNVDGGAYTIGASFSGWFWPATADAMWKLYGQ